MARPHKLTSAEPVRHGPHVKDVERRALPIEAFARAYGVVPMTVYRAIKAGRLKTVVIGKRRLVLLDSVQSA